MKTEQSVPKRWNIKFRLRGITQKKAYKIQNTAKVLNQESVRFFNPLNAELNPICHLLALLGAHPILHVSRIRVKLAFTRRLDFKLVQFALRRISSVSTNF